MTHTKEPWDNWNNIVGQKDRPDLSNIAVCVRRGDRTDIVGDANAARIVSCVNALAGIPDPAAYVAAFDAMQEALAAVAPHLNTMLIDEDPDDETIGWQSDGEGGHTKPIDFTMGQIRKVNTALTAARTAQGNT